jgi:hypothetical protein
LAAAERHADSGADELGHPLKRPVTGDFYVCTVWRYNVTVG